MREAVFFTVWILKLLFFPSFWVAFFEQHHLFWNTEWQYLLWRERTHLRAAAWLDPVHFIETSAAPSGDPAGFAQCSGKMWGTIHINVPGPPSSQQDHSKLWCVTAASSLNCQKPLHTLIKSGLERHDHLFAVRYISFIVERKGSCFISKSPFWLWLTSGHFSCLCLRNNGSGSSYSISWDLSLLRLLPLGHGECQSSHNFSSWSRNEEEKQPDTLKQHADLMWPEGNAAVGLRGWTDEVKGWREGKEDLWNGWWTESGWEED